MAFIDYEKAFDSVEASVVTKALRKQGIEEICVKILEDIYKKSTATIRLHKISERISIQKRVRQNDSISLKLFTRIQEKVFKDLDLKEA